ncbi:MAG: nitroreductase family protein [Pseudomonadota bacterium]
MDVTTAVRQRISTRAFLDKPLPQAEVADWLNTAQRAPSGGNVQPWRVIAITGAERQAVVDLAGKTLMANPAGEETDRPIYPPGLGEPYMARRRRVAAQMYEKVGIAYDDKPARMAWMAQNFTFFGAPVGLFFVLDESMGHGQWAHTGMFMQTLALLAEERGWATCMQECWGMIRPSLKAHFGLGETEMVYCGMAVGYPDPDAPVNALASERAALDEFAEFRGF